MFSRKKQLFFPNSFENGKVYCEYPIIISGYFPEIIHFRLRPVSAEKESFPRARQGKLPFILESASGKEQKAHPGDHIFPVLEFQAEFFQQRDDIDSLAFHAGVHSPRHPAGQAV